MAYPEIPLEIRPELDRRRSDAATAFQLHRWEAAADLFDETYTFLLREQERHRTRLHKGWELHNGGIARLNIPDVDGAVRRILLAYVEDMLSAGPGEETTADEGLAARVLKNFGVSQRLLDGITRLAEQYKKTKRTIPQKPDEFLNEVLADLGWTSKQAEEPIAEEASKQAPQASRRIEGLDTPFERRCFVGGNYFKDGAVLNDIKQIVADEGFDPIFSYDFEMDEADIHHHSLLLLHLCSRAVFEVSSPAGQLVELERCRDYDIVPLILRQALGDEAPGVSGMIRSMTGIAVQYFRGKDEARELIHSYLAAPRPDRAGRAQKAG